MNRFFTLLLAASCLTAVGQVPDYVPTEGLVAWYPLDGNGYDAGPSGLNGTEYGSLPTDSRNGEANGAIILDGESHINLGDSPSLNPEDALMFSAWFRLDEPNTQTGLSTILGRNKNESGNRYCYSFGVVQAEEGFELRFGLENDANGAPVLDFNTPAAINLNLWHHYAATYASTSGLMKVFLDGMFISEWNVGPIAVNQILTPTLIGFFRPNGDHSFTGAIDDLGVWNRALVDDEILTLFAEGPAVFGCTDGSACNFNAEANLEDGSCHFFCQYCKEGTVWDEAIQGCVVANPADINLDGCVQLNDLLDLLSAYGDCGAEESDWQCGDPLEYQGYDYETVQIGEQCWFAENLRAENYRNGVAITSVIDQPDYSSLWLNTSANEEGALNVYPQYESNGMVYNWYAVVDDNGLCPEGWSVPSKSNYESLIEYAELVYADDFVFSLVDDTQGLGTNETGYSATTTGYVDGQNGLVYAPTGQFQYMWFWTSTLGPFPDAWSWRINTSFGNPINQGTTNQLKSRGLAVRCIKDAE